MITIRTLHQQWNHAHTAVDTLATQLRENGFNLDSHECRKQLDAAAEQFGVTRPVHWRDMIAKPIADAIGEQLNNAIPEVLGPCGISSRVFLSWYATEEAQHKNTPLLSVAVMPENLAGDDPKSAILAMCNFNQQSERFAKGTIGELNGLNYGRIPLPNDASVEELLSLFQAAYHQHRDTTDEAQ